MGSCTKGELTDETMVLVSVTCVPVVNTEFKNRVYPADTAGMGGDGVNPPNALIVLVPAAVVVGV